MLRYCFIDTYGTSDGRLIGMETSVVDGGSYIEIIVSRHAIPSMGGMEVIRVSGEHEMPPYISAVLDNYYTHIYEAVSQFTWDDLTANGRTFRIRHHSEYIDAEVTIKNTTERGR